MKTLTNIQEHIIVIWFIIVLFVASGAYFTPFSLSSLLVVGVPFIFVNYLLKPYAVFSDNPYVILFLLMVILLCIGVFYSGAPSYGFFKFSIFSTYIFIFIFTYKLLLRRSDLFISYGVLIGLGFIILVIINFNDPYSYLIAMKNQQIRLGVDNQDGDNLNPIWLARCMGFVIICCLFFQSKGFFRILKYGLITTCIIYMLATASKGPIISLIIALVLSRFGWSFKNFVIVTLSVLLLVLLVSSSQTNVVGNEFFISRFSFGNNAAVTERIEFISEVVSRFSFATSFFGTGTGNSAIVIENADVRAYPHNIFLEVFFENGIFALMIILCLFFIGAKFINKYLDNFYFRYWLCLFLFFAVNSLVSGDLPSNQFVFFSFLCLFKFYNGLNKHKLYAYSKFS